MSTGPCSGLIVEVPEAEAAVRPYRERLDPLAPLGVPAHLTVLYPFMPPGAIDAAVLAQLGDLFAAVSRFSFRLDRTDWFGDTVLWLGPRDPRPFAALTGHVCRAFPGFPPYRGLFREVIPHLTIGEGQPLASLRAAADAVRAQLPIHGQASAVTLMTRETATGPWARTATFSLA